MRRFLAFFIALALLPLAASAAPPPDGSVWYYASDTMTIDIALVQKQLNKREKLAYFVADIRIQDPSQLRSAFATGTYNIGAEEETAAIARRSSAVIAINGDYCNHKNNKRSGIIIRDGIAYRDRSWSRDLMYIDAQGNMHIVLRDERENLTAEILMEQGTMQSFEFGPALIRDGEALAMPHTYFVSTVRGLREPRTGIGQIGPLHYLLLVADGRRKGWSDKGMTFQEMQEVFLEYDCQNAYNLDGGGSSTLFFCDQVLNCVAWRGTQRLISDIVYFID